MNILIIDNGMPFDLQSLYTHPLGGSESSALLLGYGLSKIGNNVAIANTNQAISLQFEGSLKLFSINESYNISKEADVVILNRVIPPFIIEIAKKKKIYYYTHDAYDQVHILKHLKQGIKYIDKILYVSEWQRKTFKKYLNIDHDNIILGNSIVLDDSILSLSSNTRANDKIKLCYHSIPYKGLELISDIYNNIENIENIELEVMSNMSLYNSNNDKYEPLLEYLRCQPNVKVIKPVSRFEQLQYLKNNHILLGPSLYHESFGINSVLAQSVGCLPITINSGANSEVNISESIVDVPTLLNSDNFDKYMSYLNEYVSSSNKIDELRQKMFHNIEKYDHVTIAKKFIEEALK